MSRRSWLCEEWEAAQWWFLFLASFLPNFLWLSLGNIAQHGVKRLSRSLSLDLGLRSSRKTLGFCKQRSSENIQVELIVEVHEHTARTMTMAGEGVEWEMGSS